MKSLPSLLLIYCFLLAPMAAKAQLSVDAGPDQAITCALDAVTLEAIVANGAQPVFAWSGPNNYTSTQQIITVTEPGDYTVTVTDNANGNTAVDAVLITEDFNLPVVNLTAINPGCGLAGSISMDPIPDVDVQWSNGSTGFEIVNLAPGNYCVVVTNNSNGCSRQECVALTAAPSLAIFVDPVTSICPGEKGAFDITIVGGVPPYVVNWTDLNGTILATTEDIDNLDPGFYLLFVWDASGCSSSLTMAVQDPGPATLPQVVTCSGDVNLQALFGVPPYAFIWSGPNNFLSITPNLTNVSPGAYSVTITDSNGCTQVRTIDVAPNSDPCTHIYGRLVFDGNSDCTADLTEDGIRNIPVKAEDGTATYWGMSDSTGAYIVFVEPGTYTVTPILNDPAAIICPVNPVALLAAQGDSSEVDFAIRGINPNCPLLQVSINASVIRRCFSNNLYWVSYSNIQLGAATDAYIDITLDPFFEYLESSIPATNLGNNVYRFELGTVPGNAVGNFWIRFNVSCNAVLGQTHCSEAHIYPDTLCSPNSPMWSGADLQLRSECGSDSLRFILKNIGTTTMTNTLDYIVIEDGLMYNQGMASPLAAGDSMIIAVPKNGATWRVEAEQEPFQPTQSLPVLSVEGCATAGSFSIGYVEQFAVNDLSQFVDIHCAQNTGSYDPNDKKGSPVGFGTAHYIKPHTPIDYTIRFQNTGTDTAFQVVILDTLSQWLNPASVVVGAASHPYRFRLKGSGVLDFSFDNIMLPDSNVNEALSHGFVSFKISPYDNVPLETNIYNTAAIYFDYNDPVLTNTTQHRIGENFVTVRVTNPGKQRYQVAVMPNPMQDQSIISILGAPELKTYTMRIFNLQGQEVARLQSGTPQFEVFRQQLVAGAYIFNVDELGIVGKLFVH